MFDLKWIRDNPAAFDAGLERRGLPAQSAAILALDEKRRAHLTTLQEAQARRNAASKEIGKAKGAKDEALAAKLMAEVATLKETLGQGEEVERRIDAEIQSMLAIIPNLPRDDVPDGADENDNKEVRRVGKPPKFDFKPKQHFEIGEALGLMDFEAAAKVSGARFVFLKGALARMERALAQFMLDTHTAPANGQIGGYTEVNPPMLVKDQAAYGTANLPKFEKDLFQTRLTSLDHILEDQWERIGGASQANGFAEKLDALGWETVRTSLADMTVLHPVDRHLPVASGSSPPPRFHSPTSRASR